MLACAQLPGDSAGAGQPRTDTILANRMAGLGASHSFEAPVHLQYVLEDSLDPAEGPAREDVIMPPVGLDCRRKSG